MSLFIEVYVGKRDNRILVAKAVAHNISDLANFSDYAVEKIDFGAKHLNIAEEFVKGKIESHNRKTSVWSLVGKIAGLKQE